MKVGYSKTYPNLINSTWEKSWIEDESIISNLDLSKCTDEEVAAVMLNVRKVQYALKKQVENFHYESNKAAEKQMGMSIKNIYPKEFGVPPLYENEPIEGKKLDDEVLYELNTNYQEYDLKEQIKSCNEIKVLESYKFIVKGKPELEQVYNNRLKELT